ncbi:MAG: sulfur carrier protein ThiS [Bryobacterales bacterium]|nr:sulfur carrier protein ThiS [Bryobacterales bacterium]
MGIQVNGESRTFPAGATVADVLSQLDLAPERVAVELDRAILRRDRWTTERLREGSRLEIVQFVGGG